MSIGLVLSFVISFAVAFGSTPFVKALALRIGAVDKPDEARRVHKKATPLLGGLAIFYGFVISVLCLSEIDAGVRGMIIGSMITAGVMMMYVDGYMDTKKMMKKGKQLIRKMGIM